MNWESVWKIILAAIASVGGAGAIIIAIARWLANLSADAIIKKKEFEFNTKLANIKSNLDNRNYISKVRFDLEIELYRQLSERLMQMIFENNNLFPSELVYVPIDQDERKEYYAERFKRAIETYNEFNISLARNTPFISKEMHIEFETIRKLCGTQINFFRVYGAEDSSEYYNKSRDEERMKCFERTREINDNSEQIVERLREYLLNLDVQ